jgi:hypothetical protein
MKDLSVSSQQAAEELEQSLNTCGVGTSEKHAWKCESSTRVSDDRQPQPALAGRTSAARHRGTGGQSIDHTLVTVRSTVCRGRTAFDPAGETAQEPYSDGTLFGTRRAAVLRATGPKSSVLLFPGA